MPFWACIRTARWTRSFTSCLVRDSFRRLQQWIPSKRVPDWFQTGSPAVRQVSRWTWDSMKGGSASFPVQSRVSSPGRGARPGPISSNKPLVTRMSVGVVWFSRKTF